MASHLRPPIAGWSALVMLLVSLMTLLPQSGVSAEQTCPGLGPWHQKCSEYCCVEEFDEPLEGQYCCSSCRYSFDSAVRNSFACTSSHYLHQTWAVVLMACGIAFIVLVCCTCCCCCCCAPCRRRRRSYSLPKSVSAAEARQCHANGRNERTPLMFYDAQQHQAAAAAAAAPSAPLPSMTSSYPQKGGPLPPPPPIQPPPYQQRASAPAASAPAASAPAAAADGLPPPPLYRP